MKMSQKRGNGEHELPELATLWQRMALKTL